MRLGTLLLYGSEERPIYKWCNFIGDDLSDLVLSDPGSITSEDERSSDSDDDDFSQNDSLASSVTSLPAVSAIATVSASEQEFQTEVRLSLERAFSEGHSLENASVELKTLRMASNVPLCRVREAVVAGIVERIPLVEVALTQRVEIKKWVDRWGDLINLIGGVDGVETVSILQVSTLFVFLTSLAGVTDTLVVPLCFLNALSVIWADTCSALSKRYRGGRGYSELARQARSEGRRGSRW